MKKKWIFSLGLMMLGLLAFSQQTLDYSVLFKMQLFMELPVEDVEKDYKEVIKSDTLFMLINRNMKVTLHPLKTEGFSDRFLFFEVDGDHDIEYIDFARIRYFIRTSTGCFSKYRFCIDTHNFILHRMIGFEDSDFLSFLEMLQYGPSGHRWGHKNFTTRDFFKMYKVEGIDFKCLNNGLRSKKRFNSKKYPCLLRTSSPVVLPCPVPP